MSILSPAMDAFGHALLAHLEGQPTKPLTLETDAGVSTPAMAASWFFENSKHWTAWEREALEQAHGPALDLGAGAGRASLFLQQRGVEVTALDSSPGAVEVCQRQGIHDVRLQDLTDPLPNDKAWNTVLLLCGNLGLAGSWDATRQLLADLHLVCAKDAQIIADTVDPTLMTDADVLAYQANKVAAGEYIGNVTLRLIYGEVVSPWWPQTNILVADVPRLVHGTGWDLEEHHIAGIDHYLKLRRV